jgi:tripartite ATP-independent transporter DctP family solute receptor
MKKRACVILAIALSLAIAACGSTSPSPDRRSSTDGYTGGSYNLKLGHYFSARQGTGIFLQSIADRAAELSDGKIVIDVYGESQLGGQNELCEALHIGTIDLAATDYITINSVLGNPKSIVIALPWLINDWNQSYALFHSEIFDKINSEILASYDMRYLAINTEGFKELFSRIPVYTVEDFRNIKVRVTPQPLYLEMFNALGAMPTQVATAEVYSALQTGIVNAYERPADSAYNNSLWEQTSYMIMTNHVMAHTGLFINEGVFQRLDPEAQAVIIQAGSEITDSYFALNRENDAKRLDDLVRECKQERIDIDTSELKAIAQEKIWPVLLQNVDDAQAILKTIEAMD